MPPPPHTAAVMDDPSKRAQTGRCAEDCAGREEGASSARAGKGGTGGKRPSVASLTRTGESARCPRCLPRADPGPLWDGPSIFALLPRTRGPA